LIEAMPGVLREKPDAHARIVGTGPYERELRDLIARLGLGDRVSIVSVPAGDRDAMDMLLAQASLVVLLSDYEAHPVSLLEAAALGRPILVRRTSGLTELVENGVARGVAADADAQAIAHAIVKSINQPASAGEIALPSWDDTASLLLAEYRKCVRTGR
jgi:glycosyltransferase involved in cell wall biosynthesis